MKLQKILILLFTIIGSNALAQDKVVAFLKLSPAGSFEARTNAIEGSAIKDGTGYKAQGIKVQLETLKTKMALRDQHMKEKYLETAKFPTAEIVSAEGQNGKGSGVLKIRGIEKPVSGTYAIAEGGKVLKAKFTIQLSDYGITGIRYMGVGVKDTAQIEVAVPIK